MVHYGTIPMKIRLLTLVSDNGTVTFRVKYRPNYWPFWTYASSSNGEMELPLTMSVVYTITEYVNRDGSSTFRIVAKSEWLPLRVKLKPGFATEYDAKRDIDERIAFRNYQLLATKPKTSTRYP